jgi:O-antigen ligase
LVAIAGVVFWVYASHGVMSRWSSKDESATGSAQERQELLIKSLKVTAEHPLFGIGPGNFAIISGHWRVTHNTYTQLSSEGGIPALILYLLILWRGFANVRSIKRMDACRREVRMFAGGLHASLAGFVIGSFFASEAYLFFGYTYIFFSSLLFILAKRESAAVSGPQRSVGVQREVGDYALSDRNSMVDVLG